MALTRNGGEWKIDETKGHFGTVLTNGNILVYGVRDGAGTAKDLVGQVYSADGTTIGSSFVIKSIASGEFEEASVTALANGRFAVAWSYGPEYFTTYTLETGIFNSDGSVFKAPVQVGSNKANSPEIVTLADGGYAISYYDGGYKTAVFDASGNATTTFSAEGYYGGALAGLRGGGHVTVIQGPSGSAAAIKAYLRGADGTSTEIVIKSLPGRTAFSDPTVVGLANGNFVVAWFEMSPEGSELVKAQVVGSKGALIGGEQILYRDAEARATLGSLDLEGLLDGGFAVSFVRTDSDADVYVGTYSGTGAVVTAPMLAHQVSIDGQYNPRLGVLKDGRLLVSWHDIDNDANHFQAFGTGYTPPAGTDPLNSFGLTLHGTKGKDKLVGGAGNDKFYGGYGNDTLTGLEGADVFVFNAKLGSSKTDRKVNFDTITDFKPGEDKIWLDNAILKKLGKAGSEAAPDALNKKFFKVGTKAGDKNDYLVYNKKTGILSYDADGSGAKEAIEIAKLPKKLKLSYLDFEII